jgi:serralysin
LYTAGGSKTPWYWDETSLEYAIAIIPERTNSGEWRGWVDLSPHKEAKAQLAFELWDDLIAVSMSRLDVDYAPLMFNYSSATGGRTYATEVRFPSNAIQQQAWFATQWESHDDDADVQSGTYGFMTYLHEIGHTLGLHHPGSYNYSGPNGVYTPAYIQDSHVFTVMSYFRASRNDPTIDHFGSDSRWKYPSTPMLHDVLAIQKKYGADTMTRTGNDTYGFNCALSGADANDLSKKAVFDFSINTNPIITIWDARGVDTLDASGFSTNQTINLTAGQYSSIGALERNVAIAYRCTIEKAIGGAGHDKLIGNSAANVLSGGGGNDSYFVGTGDRVIEAAGKGTDTISSVVSFTLSANVEVLTLTGDANIKGTGSTTGNKLYGNVGNNILNGGGGRDVLLGDRGSDVLIGGADADIFVYKHVKDSPKGRGRDIINDFSAADTLQLSQIDADIDGSPGNQGFRWIGTHAFTGVDGQLHYARTAAGVLLQGDLNGDKIADFEIFFRNIAKLSSADIVL